MVFITEMDFFAGIGIRGEREKDEECSLVDMSRYLKEFCILIYMSSDG